MTSTKLHEQLTSLMTTAVSGYNAPMAVVSGPSAIEFVNRWRRTMQHHFVAILSIDLNDDRIDHFSDMDTTLGQFLFGIGSDVPADLDERPARWKTATRDTRQVLVVVHNAFHDAELVTLRPSAGVGNAMVATSHRTDNFGPLDHHAHYLRLHSET